MVTFSIFPNNYSLGIETGKDQKEAIAQKKERERS